MCRQEGTGHMQVGHVSETALEMRGREGAAGTEDQGLLFSSTK